MMIVKMIMLLCLAQCLVCEELLISEPETQNNLTDQVTEGTDEVSSETKNMNETTDTTTTTKQDPQSDECDDGGFLSFLITLIYWVIQNLFSFGQEQTPDTNVTTQS
ncbi:unnamed protein product [Schistosoma turkestanicum]|nr:unnamed protein product [Schistosoma turkestanicum]